MLVGLAKTIGYLIIIYYVIKFISRYIAPIFLKKVLKDVEKKMKDQQQAQYKEERGKVGETTINKKPQSSKERSIDDGDYVDYEDAD